MSIERQILKSFDQLTADKNVEAEELKDTLKYSAENGEPITASTVLDLIKRADLSDDDRQELLRNAESGHRFQSQRSEVAAATEYKKIMDSLGPVM